MDPSTPVADGPAVARPNRRLTARRACHLHVLYATSHDWRPATAMDLSARGCRLRLGEALTNGMALTVRFERDRADGQALRATVIGVVAWNRLEGLSYQAGIHFPQDSSDLTRIIDHLD